MSSRISKIKNNKLLNNLSWIFFGSIAHAALSFLLTIVAARRFSTNDYGILSYALSLTTLFSSLCSLGLNAIITKEISDNEKKAGHILASGILLRFISAIFVELGLLLYLSINSRGGQSNLIVLVYSFSIFFSTFDLITYWFRFKYKTNVATFLKLSAFSLSALIKIIAVIKNDIVLFSFGAISESLLYGIMIVIRFKAFNTDKLLPSLKTARRLLKKTAPFILSTVLVAIYSQTDRVMLEALAGYDEVAYYSAAMAIANIIPIAMSALVEAFRPEIFKARKIDRKKYFHLYKQLYGISFWIGMFYGLVVTIFNRQILFVLFGDKYLAASLTLSLVVWYSSFSYFGAIHNIYMVAENKAKWVQLLTVVGAILNVLVNMILIPFMGAAGAALASLLTQLASNTMLPFLIPQLRPMAIIMARGIIAPFCSSRKVRDE